MKRSTFIATARQRFVGPVTTSPESLAALAEEAGVQWDPEEPELPKRVWVPSNLNILLPEGMQIEESREVDIHSIARDAAVRYNAVGSILAHDEGMIHVDHVKRLLALERERLS